MKKLAAIFALVILLIYLNSCSFNKENPSVTDVTVTGEITATDTEPVTEATDEPDNPISTEDTAQTEVKPVQTENSDATTDATDENDAPEVYTGEFDYAKSDLGEYIELGKYLGIEVVVSANASITDAQVEEKVKEAIEILPIEAMIRNRACDWGDKVNVSFVGTIEGVVFDGGSEDNFILELGSDMLIAGFEAGIVSMMPGDNKTIELTFADDYYIPDFAGKAVSFAVTLNYIYPTLTDEVAKDFFGTATAEEYREQIRGALKTEADNNLSSAKEDAAWTKALANSRIISYPETAVERAFANNIEIYTRIAEDVGLTYEQVFPTLYGLSVDEAEMIMMESSKNVVAQELLLYAIARDIGIDVSDEKFEQDLAATVAIMGMSSIDELVEQLGTSKEMLKDEKLYSEVITKIMAEANFTVSGT